MSRSFLPVTVAFVLNAAHADAAIVSMVSGAYSENFNSIATTAAAGWDVRTGATGASLGTVGNYATSTWGDGTGAFKNFAAASTGAGSDTAIQGAATDRALGVRQTGSFNDPGAAFNFEFSSSGLSVQNITIDLQMLSVQGRSTVWSVQYGIGASPSSFTTLATFSDPGTFGSTSLTIPTAAIGTALDNQAQAWFRVAALSVTSGSEAGIPSRLIISQSPPSPSPPPLFSPLSGFSGFFAAAARRARVTPRVRGESVGPGGCRRGSTRW